MPRKQIPKRYFSRVYADTQHKLSDYAQTQLSSQLGKKNYSKFLPIAEQIIGRYKKRVKIYESQPKLNQIRASLKELTQHATGLSYGIDSLDGDTYEFVHTVLCEESQDEPELSDFDLNDSDDLNTIENILCSDSALRWNKLQELMEQVESEMSWLSEVITHSLSLVKENNKPGPQKAPLFWLVEKTIEGLRGIGVEQLNTTRNGVVSVVVRVLCEESGDTIDKILDRDYKNEITKALKNNKN